MNPSKIQDVIDIIVTNFKSIDKVKFIYIIPLFVAFIFIIAIFDSFREKRKVQKTFTVKKNRNNYLVSLTNKLCKHKRIKKIIIYIAKKLCMFNDYSLEKNMNGATVVILIYSLSLVIAMFYLAMKQYLLWYVTFIYLCIITAFLTIFLVTLVVFARGSFNKKLPDTFRIINSRFVTNRTIMQAIKISLDDLNGSVQREMRRIYNVLRKNDPIEIKETFKILEENYNNQYFTLLLMLIQKAHYKGGKEEIKDMFADSAEEILNELQHSKDISYTTRMYIIFSFFITIPFIWGAEKFNILALGDYAKEFFNSTTGITIKLCIILAELVFVGLMLLMEKIGG
ncbi:hypothetical protein [Vallitalea guaymasensis]|uniref:hypothetical protein n=1 Tax=Vallitalea guaymasensis TaxID=1185412 RepID=UPI000DE36FA7|nr:hypothetical protein [Vallitalea guaymasensis]